MPISEMELKEALKRASSLMTEEGQRKINNVAKMNNGNFDNNGDFTQPIESQNMRKMVQENKDFIKPNPHSKLPKAIQESMLKKPIDNSMLDYDNNTTSEHSVLDSINYMPKTQQMVQETYTAPAPQYNYQQPHYIPQPQMSIDYNYIRAIVNECVQANLKLIKEEILNESSLKAIRIGGENKIQLIDTKNNLYESKLEYKKNLTKK